MLISLVVPCYNEEESLPYFYDETTKVIDSMGCDCEMISLSMTVRQMGHLTS